MSEQTSRSKSSRVPTSTDFTGFFVMIGATLGSTHYFMQHLNIAFTSSNLLFPDIQLVCANSQKENKNGCRFQHIISVINCSLGWQAACIIPLVKKTPKKQHVVSDMFLLKSNTSARGGDGEERQWTAGAHMWLQTVNVVTFLETPKISVVLLKTISKHRIP